MSRCRFLVSLLSDRNRAPRARRLGACAVFGLHLVFADPAALRALSEPGRAHARRGRRRDGLLPGAVLRRGSGGRGDAGAPARPSGRWRSFWARRPSPSSGSSTSGSVTTCFTAACRAASPTRSSTSRSGSRARRLRRLRVAERLACPDRATRSVGPVHDALAVRDRDREAPGPLRSPPPPPATDPFALILLENCAYLADDERRKAAFARLEAKTGLDRSGFSRRRRPCSKSASPRRAGSRRSRSRSSGRRPRSRSAITRRPERGPRSPPGGGHPGVEEVPSDRRARRREDPPLRRQGSDPRARVNGLRSLVRLGFGEDHRDYRRSYKSAQEAVRPELPKKPAALVAAYLLLRAHGQELCRRSSPKCPECPLEPRCPSAGA